MRYNLLVFAILLPACTLYAQNQPPVISNLAVAADWPNNNLTITYDVADEENDPLEITLAFSADGGKTYSLSSQVAASGDVGFPVTPGAGRSISCDISALANMPAVFTVRLVADDKQTFDIQQLVDQVDSLRLKADLEFVEGIRHRNTGLQHLNEVRDSLRNHFSALGFFTEDQTFVYSGATGRNILGHQAGTGAAQKVVIADAHYDTVNNSPGADDNGSGVVGLMEISRLLSRYPANKTLRYIGFDMEEDGLQGSIAYLSNGIPAGEQFEGVFNFEMIGYYSEQPNSQNVPAGFNLLFPAAYGQIAADEFRGNFITNVANTNSQPLAQLISDAAAQYVPDLKVITLVTPGIGELTPDLLRSDHAPFWFSGSRALMLTDGANFRNEEYHTPDDTSGALNFTFMSNVVKATLAAAAQLAEIQHGDWAVATFQGLSGTDGAPDCRFSVWYGFGATDVLNISATHCPYAETFVDVLDVKGALLHREALTMNEYEQHHTLWLPHLPAGIYFAKITSTGGVHTEKFMVHR